ncbi:MAG TPA: VOC family protein [Mycobacteriales bacterium]|jgi:catechol 2,3-dioxygenase-like lactoylglutathione lyase family enzyme|nr:VOC family protein [Mycobacteriales bacterium]
MIGQLHSVVFDASDPAGLAEFYIQLLGARVVTREDDWVVIVDTEGRRLAFQRAPQHEPPKFPDPKGSQQMHLDVLVDDIDKAEREVLKLGAARLPGEGEDFQVFADPAGHPFCLVTD